MAGVDRHALIIERSDVTAAPLRCRVRRRGCAIGLWVCFAWLHAEIAVHSPLLVLTSAEGDTGKTTACSVIQLMTPRSYAAAELTGPNLYRFVDHLHPTLIVDDADKLLERKPDLVHIINVSWTRGTKIPRQDHGITRWFDVLPQGHLRGECAAAQDHRDTQNN